MVQITFNPDTGNAWTATLKEGENTIGRAEDNDIRVGEGGVSGYHCRVSVTPSAIVVTDLNSTNGTHFNGGRVQQATWAPGQVIHLGSIPVRLEASVAAARVATPAVAAVRATPVVRIAANASPHAPAGNSAAPAANGTQIQVPTPGPVRLRISGHTDPPPAPPLETTPSETPESDAPGEHPNIVFAPAGTNCRSHGKSPAAWTCPTCKKYFCDLCVSTRATSSGATHTCRGCGVECLPVRVEFAPEAPERGFFARIPGAFAFPVRGIGVFILIFATVIFEGSGFLAGMFAWIIRAAVFGYLFVFMQDIIHGTAVGEEKMPGLPEFDGLFTAFFKLLGTILISFILPIGLGIAMLSDVEIPMSALIASLFASLLYFPMAFLAVAMLDSVAAANPLVVVPSILKVPGQYLITVVLISAVAALHLFSTELAKEATRVTFSTTDMSVLFVAMGGRILLGFVKIYLLTAGIRVLGLLYVTQKEKLGWL